jgi:hypothetical protein
MSYTKYWELEKTIYSVTDCHIIIVKPFIIPELSKTDVEDLNSKKWVVKIISNKRFKQNELGRINSYEVYNSKYSVKFPKNEHYRSGRYDKWSWYVIEYLPDYIKSSNEVIKKNIGTFVTDITNFLEWLHIEKNKIHGDIKAANIICDISKNMYRLIDFEHLDNVHELLCINDLPNGYYYFAFGCDFNKPFNSYRNDLEAFGYIIWTILESTDNIYKLFDWQEKAIFYYTENSTTNNVTYLEDLKKNHSMNTPEIMKEYFGVISQLDWNEKNPSKEIYEKIRNIFTSFSLKNNVL